MRRPKARPASRMSPEDGDAALKSILEGYKTFLARSPAEAEDPKAFASHHAAGRACLNHYEQLQGLVESGDGAGADFDETLRLARDAMAADGAADGNADRKGDDPDDGDA